MSIFSKNKQTKLGSNVFDLSHDRKFSGKMGNLNPVFLMDLVPGDKVTVSPHVFLRFAPLIAPVMHQVNVYVHMFFVPNRLLWNNWEQFITSGANGLANPTFPYFQFPFEVSNGDSDTYVGSLADYLGLPVESATVPVSRSVSAIPFAAYQMIYDEYYRDQNLISPVKAPSWDNYLISGNNNATRWPTLGKLQKRAWQHDYFTAALPWTQRGPQAMLPLQGEADIKYRMGMTDHNQFFRRGSDDEPFTNDRLFGSNDGANPDNTWLYDSYPTTGTSGKLDLNDTHYTDLSTATATSIEELRRAVKLQEYLEKMARGGARYTEFLEVIFGVKSQDYRLQRPEYVGGYSAPVKVSEVLQTAQQYDPSSGDPVGTPTGNMSGHAVSVGAGTMSYYAHEHGYLMGIMSVMPRAAYQQGIPKHFIRTSKFDYYTPDFAHIGEQPILEKEIFQDTGTGNAVFGYTPRYAEYKYVPSSVHGDFRTTLDFWHMGRKFATKPLLNKDFIEMDYTEIDRIFAIEDNSDHMWCQVFNSVKARRKMPYFGNPKF